MILLILITAYLILGSLIMIDIFDDYIFSKVIRVTDFLDEEVADYIRKHHKLIQWAVFIFGTLFWLPIKLKNLIKPKP